MSLRLRSPAFEDGGPMPDRHGCDGEDLSPPLVWTGAPEGTRSFVLWMEDPDAPDGGWVHWVLYDLDAGRRELPAGIPPGDDFEEARQGLNDFGETGYGGPCPPPGQGPHRYVFTLKALDVRPDLCDGAGLPVILESTAGHVLAEASLTGRYERG